MLGNMIYGKDRCSEVIASGNFHGFDWLIMSYGTHPCAYVIIDKKHPLFGMHYNEYYELYEGLDVHGGVTYSEFGLGDHIGDDRWVIGWDYTHYGDYNGSMSDLGGRKYSAEEIYNDIVDCINSLVD